MDIKEFSRRFPEKYKKMIDFVHGEAKVIMKNEAIDHFKHSFVNEGFTDESLDKWPEVERRKEDSPWFGHSGQTGKFSAARTTAKILTGETNELQNAFSYKITENGVTIINDKPYAAVHQYGKMAKIYGKKAFTMPRRRFVGNSKVLVRKIKFELKTRLLEIIRSK
jgi:phage gpG-like protein